MSWWGTALSRLRGRRGHTPPPPAPQPSPLPAKHRTNKWIIGWKIANLLVTPEGEVCFSSLNQDGLTPPIGLDDKAECTQFPRHVAPEASHHCGFNAFHDRVEAERLWHKVLVTPKRSYVTDNLVLLRVGLYGRVQDGTHPDGTTWGYKAEKQRVANVFVPRTCGGATTCQEGAVGLGVIPNDPQYALPGTGYLRPLCESHLAQTPAKAGLEVFAHLAGIPFAWYEYSSSGH